MKYFNQIVATLMGISFSLAAQLPADDIIQASLGNYTITDIKWEVPITSDRTETVTGTIEDVMRHLEAVAPGILEANITSVPGPVPEPASVPAPIDGGALTKRKPSKLLCDNLRADANVDRIGDGIDYLSNLQGKPTNGPKSCGRVSCSYRSAIWWCNDNSDSLTLGGWNYIATGANAVTNGCSVKWHKRINGQAFYDGWNVMVLGEPNC